MFTVPSRPAPLGFLWNNLGTFSMKQPKSVFKNKGRIRKNIGIIIFYQDCQNRGRGREGIPLVRIELAEHRAVLVPGDAGFQHVPTPTILLKQGGIDMQPDVCEQNKSNRSSSFILKTSFFSASSQGRTFAPRVDNQTSGDTSQD